MKLAELVYRYTRKLPSDERFALVDQMRRCAVSIPSNIAEGQKRIGKAEMAQFCGIALGSCAELETQLLLGNRLFSLVSTEELQLCEEVAKMLTGLIKALRTKN